MHSEKFYKHVILDNIQKEKAKNKEMDIVLLYCSDTPTKKAA